MSGFFENWFEPKLDSLASKISFLPELKNKEERKLGASHIGFMAWTTLLFVSIAYVSDSKWLNLFALANYLQVIVAEWPPKGRRIDWVTRSLGWFIGAIPAILALFLR